MFFSRSPVLASNWRLNEEATTCAGTPITTRKITTTISAPSVTKMILIDFIVFLPCDADSGISPVRGGSPV